jgi:signal transduction histidine kinase
MKLIEKTTFYYLVFTLFIFILGTVLFYFLIKKVLVDGIDEALHQEKIQITQNLAYENDFIYLKPSENVTIRLSKLNKLVKDQYSTVSIFDSVEKENQNFRQLKSVYLKRNKYYEITIQQSLEESEALIKAILPVEIVLFLILLAGILIINRLISNRIWQPFYGLLKKLETYNLAKHGIISYHKSDIDEFDNLSTIVDQMTQKIYNDFVSQKEFNENSSHELQTPLAIMRNKLELLIQSSNLKQEEMHIVETVFDALNRLSQLNKGLILLSKIDNQQYADSERIDMVSLLNKILSNFHEKIQNKKLLLIVSHPEECSLRLNSVLAEILLNNLLSNAIKHNIEGGDLNVELTDSYLKITNTGDPLSEPASNMFGRFKKKQGSEFSVGLGLSIVKKICDMFKYEIEYINKGNFHTIKVSF